MCKACGHPYEDHIFGGMCRYCDCRRCVYNAGPPAVRREPQRKPAAEPDGWPEGRSAPVAAARR
ncbi:MAG: hypothetical protein Q7T33_07655 [Dehalococcoidia bacterium]|nr:hypothetical protein [Dehalococcoidia bacterium]